MQGVRFLNNINSGSFYYKKIDKSNYQTNCFKRQVEKDSFVLNYQPDTQKVPLNLNSPKFVRDITASVCKKNKLGEGYSAVAYDFNNHPELVIRIPKKTVFQKEDLSTFKKVTPFKTKYNYGQVVYKSKNGVELREKVDGSNLDLKKRHQKLIKRRPFTQKDAKKLYDRIQLCADLPQKAYDDLAVKIKTLYDTNFSIDYYAGSNILIDEKKKEFNIIDLWEKGKFGSNGKPGFVVMVSLLTESMFLGHACSALPEDKKEIYLKNIDTIINKSFKASKSAGLPYGKEDYMTVIDASVEYENKMYPAYINSKSLVEDFFKKYNL